MKQENNVYFTIDVPVIQPFSFPRDVRIGQRTFIVCAVKEGSEPFEFSWLKEDKPITGANFKSSQSDVASTLSLNPIQSQDGGNYTCIIKNPVGSASYSTILFIEREFHPLEIKRFLFTHSLLFFRIPILRKRTKRCLRD